jgi:hypothetical protein
MSLIAIISDLVLFSSVDLSICIFFKEAASYSLGIAICLKGFLPLFFGRYSSVFTMGCASVNDDLVISSRLLFLYLALDSLLLEMCLDLT